MTETRSCPRCGASLPPGTPPEMCPRCLMRRGFDSGTGAAGGGRGDPSAPSESESGAPSEARPFFTGARRPQPPPPAPEEIARDFPQLEVLELLGRGGMGVVYKARQKSLDRLVALKLLAVDAEADPAFAERFAREARALAALSHPSIVAVHDSGQAGGRYYLLMEYVDGTDLRRMIRAGRVAPREALAIVSQVCDALQYAHDQGVVHRDIKPENILVDRKGRVRIADFGLAKLLGRPATSEALTGPFQAMGTLHYMAPEQLERPLEVDHRADIYSLGVVFYELLTGELPLGRFAPPSHKIEVDVRVDEVVLKTLEKDLPRRYQHASEVKTEVDDISAAPARARAAAAAGAGHRRVGAKRWHAVLLGVLAAGLLAQSLILFGLLWLGPRARGDETGPLGLLLPLLVLFLGVLAGIGFISVVASRARSGAESRPAWPWVLGATLLCIALLPFGCAALGALLFVPRRMAAGRARAAEVEASNASQLALARTEIAAGLARAAAAAGDERHSLLDALIDRPDLTESDRTVLIDAVARAGREDPRWAAGALIRLSERGRTLEKVGVGPADLPALLQAARYLDQDSASEVLEEIVEKRVLGEADQLRVVGAVMASTSGADAVKVLRSLLRDQQTTPVVRERIRAALGSFGAEQQDALRAALQAAEAR